MRKEAASEETLALQGLVQMIDFCDQTDLLTACARDTTEGA